VESLTNRRSTAGDARRQGMICINACRASRRHTQWASLPNGQEGIYRVRIGRTPSAAVSERATPDNDLNEAWVASAQRGGRRFWSREVVRGFLVAVVGPGVIIWLRYVVGAVGIEPPALILFAVPILLAVHVGGFLPGLLATALSALLSVYCLITLPSSFAITDMIDAMALVALVLVGVLASVLGEARRRASHRLDAVGVLQAVTLASVGDAVIATDIDGHVRFLNPKAEELTGWPAAEATGRPVGTVFRIVNEQTQRPCENPVAKVLATGLLVGLANHTLLLARDGRRILVKDSGAPIRLPNGTLVGVLLVFRDATEERLIEQGLQRQVELQDRLTKIAMSVPGAIYSFHMRHDRTVGIPVASPAFLEVSGFAPEAVAENVAPLLSCVHPDDLAELRRSVLRSARRLTPWHAEFRYRHTLKGERWLEGNSVPWRETDGSIRWDGFVADVTERIGMERQLHQAQKMEAIGTLTGGLAHDFNNLLGVVIANLDLARARLPDVAEASELVDDALEAALRGADLTQRLLAFARRQPLQPERVAPNDLVAGMVKLFGRTLGESIRITLDLAPDLWATVVDPAQLQASLTNLATNARDAMPKGGRLSIVTANRRLDADYAAAHPDVVPGDYAMIEVSDNGTGMLVEVQSRIFEPFFSTKPSGEGSGLGLSMVFGFVKQSSGHIGIYSEPGRGTAVRLYLPRMEEAALPIQPADAAPSAGNGETVLIVEDNGALRRAALRQFLDLGYRALEADGPAQALAVLVREPVDLLFSDIVMPGPMDGLALADEALRRLPLLKVLLTSGFAGVLTSDRLAARGEPMHLLGKPYRQTELARAVQEALHG
jgi:PAS domain S-box-containing protein